MSEILLRKPRTVNELSICVDQYLSLNDYSFLPADRTTSLNGLIMAVRMRKLVMIAERAGAIVGWFYADIVKPQHMHQSVLQQMYFSSILSGRPAHKFVIDAHKIMIERAESLGLQVVTSSSSHLDESYVFARILEKNGWERRGYLAAWKTSHFKE